jgi:hypothetical protein
MYVHMYECMYVHGYVCLHVRIFRMRNVCRPEFHFLSFFRCIMIIYSQYGFAAWNRNCFNISKSSPTTKRRDRSRAFKIWSLRIPEKYKPFQCKTRFVFRAFKWNNLAYQVFLYTVWQNLCFAYNGLCFDKIISL